jgi:copper(I)-binding protein
MHARHTLPGLALVAVLALSACGSSDAAASDDATSGGAAPATTAGEQITIDDAWVKAADSGMSAAFGEIENTGDAAITVVAVTSPASTALELHETVADASGAMVMQQKEGGFTIPAGGALTLEPGGNHIMLMDLVDPLRAGDEVTFTLTFSDDSTFAFTAPAKDYSGANESYMGDMDMDHCCPATGPRWPVAADRPGDSSSSVGLSPASARPPRWVPTPSAVVRAPPPTRRRARRCTAPRRWRSSAPTRPASPPLPRRPTPPWSPSTCTPRPIATRCAA